MERIVGRRQLILSSLGLAAVGCTGTPTHQGKEYPEVIRSFPALAESTLYAQGNVHSKLGDTRWFNFLRDYRFDPTNASIIYDHLYELGTKRLRYILLNEPITFTLHPGNWSRDFFFITEETVPPVWQPSNINAKLPGATYGFEHEDIFASYIRSYNQVPGNLRSTVSTLEEMINHFFVVEAAQSALAASIPDRDKSILAQEGFNNGVGLAYTSRYRNQSYDEYYNLLTRLTGSIVNSYGQIQTIPAFPLPQRNYENIPTRRVLVKTS